jgi:hypothetical protein
MAKTQRLQFGEITGIFVKAGAEANPVGEINIQKPEMMITRGPEHVAQNSFCQWPFT